jgi:hypothetical protein
MRNRDPRLLSRHTDFSGEWATLAPYRHSKAEGGGGHGSLRPPALQSPGVGSSAWTSTRRHMRPRAISYHLILEIGS